MEKMKPYWFLEDPLDQEHKYYILMAFLKKVEDSTKKRGFEKLFKEGLTIMKDLDYFVAHTEFTQRTMGKMTNSEKDTMYNLLDKNLDEMDEIFNIIESSIKTINKFLDKNADFHQRYNSLVEVEQYCPNKYNVWNSGFIVIRKKEEPLLRIYNWFFSTIRVGQEENIGLLMSEILEPVCKTTYDIETIKKFLKKNIKDFSHEYDCILVADVDSNVDMDTGTDIGKEKSADIIMERFTNN